MDMLSIGSEHSVRNVWSGVIKPRKKRNALSLGEKIKVIEQLEQGWSQREIAITMHGGFQDPNPADTLFKRTNT